ncbi:HotDog domain-containing protein [Coprinopsis sp. MPI-PUGE-AT-0042]|nr:HotDog domain-containing protein [Coprinopsis sp. MPI-PUGE-AT-0042]
MSSRHLSIPATPISALSPISEPSTSTIPKARSKGKAAWVDPASLPYCGDTSSIAGNAPDYVKQLIYNTYITYGVGDEDCFGSKVGRSVKFVEVNIRRKQDRKDRLEATVVAELEVTKHMLNGAGMLHGGCLAYIVDNTPLVVLGLVQNTNGVGVTQSMNVQFHSPAPPGSLLKITSTSVSLGGRVMSSRCEVIDEESGRIIASAFLSKMQPVMAKL